MMTRPFIVAAVIMPPPEKGGIRVAPIQNKSYTITISGKPKVHTNSEYMMILEYE